MTQKELTDKLDLASQLYYAGKPSPLTDTEFDLFLKDLQKMERESGVIYPNSPTVRVGSDIQDGFKKGKHPKSMLTIENVYDDEGLTDWITSKIEKYGTFTYLVGIKYDGISCELHYVNGVLEKALTRGDKIVGDDITENVKTIKTVPLTIREDVGERFYVRGEILLPKSRLTAINELRVSGGENPFSNTRNACSGTIKSLDPREVAKRGLIFRAWDCFGDEIDVVTMDEKVGILENCGFYFDPGTFPECILVNTSVNDGRYLVDDLVKKVNEYKSYIDELNLDYDYDGVVLKINDIKTQDAIGIKDTRAVEWAIARKWNEEYVVKTKLIGVDWQVGRTGVLTPVGRLEPVECGGVVISNVTLNNMDFIESLHLRIGDTLKITRSGGVIPYVLDSEPEEGARDIEIPVFCPECWGLVIRDGTYIKCTNKNCPAVVKGKILQFCSKDCMDIRSIGESVVSDLVDKGLVSNIADLYSLRNKTVEELVSILGAGYGEKKVNKILEEIEKSKTQPWSKVLAGLSIPGVGKVVARTLSAYGHETLMNIATEAFFCSFEGIGEIMAHDIYEWFNTEYNMNLLLSLSRAGLQMEPEEANSDELLSESSTALNGLTVCFTGTSSKFKGDEVEAFLEKNGAKCASGVSKKLDYLIVGSKPGGSKVKKAQELGVKIITEDDFWRENNL